MELNEKIIESKTKLLENQTSTIMLTLNSRLSLDDAKIVSKYYDWKKF